MTAVVLVSLAKSTLFIETPQVAINAPVVVGKPSTPTPEGVYLLEKAYSTHLKSNILIFRRDDTGVYAIHENLKNRNRQIDSVSTADNRLSGGCIGVRKKDFDKLWQMKQPIVLQVY